MKSYHWSVDNRNATALYALSWAIWTASSAAPSIRLNALSEPLSSTTARHIGVDISVAFRSAAAMTSQADSALMLDFGNVLMAGSPFGDSGLRGSTTSDGSFAHIRRVEVRQSPPEP